MTTVRTYNRNGRREIIIEGHANHSEYGKDIVCAAISTLAYTLVGALKNAGQGVEYTDKPGYFTVNFPVSDKSYVIFDTIMIGLMQIEKSYPKNVKILRTYS